MYKLDKTKNGVFSLVYHLIVCVKYRQKVFVRPDIIETMKTMFCNISKDFDVEIIEQECGEDHVHILSTLSRTCEAAEMVKEIKRGSSLWLKTKSPDLNDFAWQNGYGIFSVGFSQVETVKHYIAGQEEHHRKVSFQDEFREFLRKYAIEFDERYVWD